jgi:hypothetical protein
LSIWDNGAGSRQVQFLSPFEVFFPDNSDVREAWSPLFTVYKYSHSPSGEERNSILWDAVTWRRDGSGNLEEFHLGPFLAIHHGAGGSSGRILGFDFGTKPSKDTMAHR